MNLVKLVILSVPSVFNENTYWFPSFKYALFLRGKLSTNVSYNSIEKRCILLYRGIRIGDDGEIFLLKLAGLRKFG